MIRICLLKCEVKCVFSVRFYQQLLEEKKNVESKFLLLSFEIVFVWKAKFTVYKGIIVVWKELLWLF